MEARCIVCGGRPAALMPMERNVGMIVVRRVHRTDGPFCRDHGIERAQHHLRLTLVLGWWGIISFFVNFAMIAKNLKALQTARALPGVAAMSDA